MTKTPEENGFGDYENKPKNQVEEIVNLLNDKPLTTGVNGREEETDIYIEDILEYDKDWIKTKGLTILVKALRKEYLLVRREGLRESIDKIIYEPELEHWGGRELAIDKIMTLLGGEKE